MDKIDDCSVDLIVTSPPYPMIEMWDDIFVRANPKIKKNLDKNSGSHAFELMHQVLDRVWDEVFRVLKKGGFCCINIGDATRTLGDNFTLYPNHSRILSYLYQKGMTPLPAILWRKQTNAPNKFMGSGMLPAGAYVTLEHEYLLIFRKGGKREFETEQERLTRQQSAIFWEERNQWFSDVWMELKGTRQNIGNKNGRERSAAFPFEIPYRLINMFSVKGDTVLDPFLGIGTTMFAAMASARNSIGYELKKDFKDLIVKHSESIIDIANQIINSRLANHLTFIRDRISNQKTVKHMNSHYQFPVMTNQEKNLLISRPMGIKRKKATEFEVIYDEKPQDEFCFQGDIDNFNGKKERLKKTMSESGSRQIQRELFKDF